ncbi:MAG: hypothetical protein LQ343_002597 [Gyalolechia ehrenbergii]|nr:MAG: hypothetical protein LQ343_002597 [Gyalolechia ehrenbergii]
MAPVQEDFVLTISDNESILTAAESDESLQYTSHQSKPSKLKRKRDTAAGQNSNGSSGKGGRRPSKKQKMERQADSENEEEEELSWAAGGEDDGTMESDFEFQVGDVYNGVTEDFDGWELDGEKDQQRQKRGVDIDELIAKRRKSSAVIESANNPAIEDVDGLGNESGAEEGEEPEEKGPGASDEVEELDEDETLAPDGFGMGVGTSDEESVGEREIVDDEDSDASSTSGSMADPLPHPDDNASDTSPPSDDQDPEEQILREAFFAPEEETKKSKSKDPLSNSFQNMSLSRPILRGLASVGFTVPTPIQSKTIPMALLGKDVVGGAVTGSGKTAAFIVPILERLLYRPKKVPTSRVAILMPTRELAVQCFNVSQKLASFTDITFCQLVGGFSLREQESVLRNRPDVIIATPGRFIDHMRNSASFTLDTLEILVLDEADRMLEDGFADELNEILTTIPKSRQTMLFSATMTDRVDKLIRLGLNRPVRLLVDSSQQTVTTLTQEFVRLRPGREDRRLGYLLHLCTEIFTDRTIVFFRQKKEAHRVRILFALCGLKAAELHGNMSQDQRISALTSFRTGQVSHLLATDVASRGLDIKGVNTVLNYTAPQSLNIYLHRVGRTARAGAPGRACTLAAEPDRKIVKAAVKTAKAQGAKVASRTVDVADADKWQDRIDSLSFEIDSILDEEKEMKQMTDAERDVKKGENLIEHEAEIKSRPKRTWFESEKEKKVAKAKGAVELNGVQGGGRKKKEGKLSGKERKKLDLGKERREGRAWKKGKGEGVPVGQATRMGKGTGKGSSKGKVRRPKKR